jgi:hypothetical protein
MIYPCARLETGRKQVFMFESIDLWCLFSSIKIEISLDLSSETKHQKISYAIAISSENISKEQKGLHFIPNSI